MQAGDLGPVGMSSVATEPGRPACHGVSECCMPPNRPKAADNASFPVETQEHSLSLLPSSGNAQHPHPEALQDRDPCPPTDLSAGVKGGLLASEYS